MSDSASFGLSLAMKADKVEDRKIKKLWAVITALKAEREHLKLFYNKCAYKECKMCEELMTATDNALSEVDNNA